jgi:predicted short-subunit dehydrogenase-like oxidoreductase (DUF2520 family)
MTATDKNLMEILGDNKSKARKTALTRPVATKVGYAIESQRQKSMRIAKEKAQAERAVDKAIHTDVARNYHHDLYRDDNKDYTPVYKYRSGV